MVERFPPETPAQAKAWDLVKANATRFGLCERCASQIAWAHQSHTGGFDAARPLCGTCVSLIGMLPRLRSNGWRSVAGDAKDIRNWPVPVTGGAGAVLIPGIAVSDRDRDARTESGQVPAEGVAQ